MWIAVQTLWQSYEGLRHTAVAMSKLPSEVQWFLSGMVLGAGLLLRPVHLTFIHDHLEPVCAVFDGTTSDAPAGRRWTLVIALCAPYSINRMSEIPNHHVI
jgi:hypothetical protein